MAESKHKVEIIIHAAHIAKLALSMAGDTNYLRIRGKLDQIRGAAEALDQKIGKFLAEESPNR